MNSNTVILLLLLRVWVVALLARCSVATLTASQIITIEGTQYEYPVMMQYLPVFNSQSHFVSSEAVQLQYFNQSGAVDDLPVSALLRLQQNIVAMVTNDQAISTADRNTLISTGGTLLQIPYITTAVNIVSNLPAIAFVDNIIVNLNFTSDVIAKIFTGVITVWNDPAILVFNPNLLSTYNVPLKLVARTDGSTTIYDTTNYLSYFSPDIWTTGATRQPTSFPSDTLLVASEEELVDTVLTIQNTFSYCHRRDARAAGLATASVQNKAGNFVYPTEDTLTTAVTSFIQNDLLPQFDADWQNVILAAATDPNAYPISSFIYLFVYENPLVNAMTVPNQFQAIGTLTFLQFIVSNAELTTGYVAVPPILYQLIQQKADSVAADNTAQILSLAVQGSQSSGNVNGEYRISTTALAVCFGIVVLFFVAVSMMYCSLRNSIKNGTRRHVGLNQTRYLHRGGDSAI
jgi:ABC-type phosphate transport system substrate-binding protein